MTERKIPSPRQSILPETLAGVLNDIARVSHRELGNATLANEYRYARNVADYTTDLLRYATSTARRYCVDPERIPVPRSEILIFQAPHQENQDDLTQSVAALLDMSSDTLPPEIQKLLKYTSTGTAFASLRKERKLTQQLLADRSGVSKSAVDKLEREVRIAEPETVDRLCDGLDMDLTDPRRILLQQMAINEKLKRKKQSQRKTDKDI